MNEFLIFHSAGNNPLATVERIRKVAKDCAKKLRKKVGVMAVNIDATHAKNKHRQTNQLIECTTVVDDSEVVDHDVDPSDKRICEMISELP